MLVFRCFECTGFISIVTDSVPIVHNRSWQMRPKERERENIRLHCSFNEVSWVKSRLPIIGTKTLRLTDLSDSILFYISDIALSFFSHLNCPVNTLSPHQKINDSNVHLFHSFFLYFTLSLSLFSWQSTTKVHNDAFGSKVQRVNWMCQKW